MGARVHVPRALTAAAASLLAGCIDFVAPGIPQIGGPAVFQVSARVTPVGEFQLDAVLEPGIDEDGFRRTVPSEPVVAMGDSILPDDIEADGTHVYIDRRVAFGLLTAGPISIEAPVVAGVASPPAIRWSGLVGLDPDTIVVAAGEDLVLHPQIIGTDEPRPVDSSWTLLLRSGGENFRIGANGPPPPQIRVPAEWLPDQGGSITADLSYDRTRSDSMSNYIGVFFVSLSLRWTVVRTSAERGSPHPGGVE